MSRYQCVPKEWNHREHKKLSMTWKAWMSLTIWRDKQTKTADRQQPKEQREYRVENCKYHYAAQMQSQHSSFGKTCSVCGRKNHFRVLCQSLMGQTQTRQAPHQPRHMHDSHKEDEVSIPSQVDSVSMKCLVFNSIKLVIFTRLDSSISKKQLCIK